MTLTKQEAAEIYQLPDSEFFDPTMEDYWWKTTETLLIAQEKATADKIREGIREMPLAKIPSRLQDFGEYEHIWNEAAEAQRDLCLEALGKAEQEDNNE